LFMTPRAMARVSLVCFSVNPPGEVEISKM